MKRLAALIGAVALLLVIPVTALGATHLWQGNGWPVLENCDDAPPGSTVWIWTGGTPTALTINGVVQAGSWVQSGNGSWKFISPWFDEEPDHATTFVMFTGDAGILTITHGCPPEVPTPTPPTPTPPTPTPPTPTPPTPTPPTPTPPTPTPPTPTPPTPTPPEIAQFSVEPAACRFDGDDTRLRIRVIAGLIILSQLDFYIDGNFIDRDDIDFQLVDGEIEAFLVVEPGLRAWTITEEGEPEAVLAEGETLCPTCFNIATPTPPPGAPTSPGITAPPTDTISSATASSGGSAVAVALLAISIAILFAVPRRRRLR